MTCRHTEAVLARYLDGSRGAEGHAVHGPDREVADGLQGLPRRHLDACSECRAALARARRLDAALAAATGHEAARHDPPSTRMEGWLDAAAARGRAQAFPPARRPGHGGRRRAASPVASSALFLAGFAAAALLWPRSPDGAGTDRPSSPYPVQGGRGVAGSDPDPIPMGLLREEERRRPISRRPKVESSALAFLPVPPFPAPGPRLALHALRSAAAIELIESGRLSTAIRWLAIEEPGPALTTVARRAAGHRLLFHRLRASIRTGNEVESRQACAAALRIDSRVLDREVRRRVADRPELAEWIAATLARSPHRERRAGLLLDLWDDLAGRGRIADDSATAHGLFGAQPTDSADELAAELIVEIRTTHNAARRIRALLALGVCRSPLSVPELLAHLQGTRFEEAMAAGWALSRQPLEVLESLPRPASRPHRQTDRYLLRAALAGAQAPQAEAWIESMDLTPEERAFLRGGAWTPAQFPIAVALFRRSSSPGASAY